MKHKHKPPFCDENPIDCYFYVKNYPAGETVRNDDQNINYLIFCRTGHARISSTLFHDEILCAGEVMFVPRGCECSGVALSDVTLLVHKFNNTVCQSKKCILAYLYSHRHLRSKIYCCKLTAPKSLQIFMTGIVSYLTDETPDDMPLESDLTPPLADFNADKKTPLTLGGTLVETPEGRFYRHDNRVEPGNGRRRGCRLTV